MTLTHSHEWAGPAADPNDDQFGDRVTRTTLADADAHAAVLVGEPYDGAVVGRRGARAGPAAIRESLTATKTHHAEFGPVTDVGDLGDVAVPDADVATVQETVRETAAAVHDADAFPVFLGGDNSLTVANVAPLLSDSVGVVSLDAHLDCREVREGPTSGTPYRQLFAAGLDALAVVGARHFETSTAYHEFLDRRGGSILTADAVGEDVVAAANAALAAMDAAERVYVSLDVDVLDAAFAPGVSAPTPGGLSTRELFRLLARLLGDDRVCGFEVVECAPPLDEGGRTTDAAARAVAHALAARRRGGAA